MAEIALTALMIVLIGGFYDWGRGPFYGVGWYGGGWLGLVLVVVIFIILTHQIRFVPGT